LIKDLSNRAAGAPPEATERGNNERGNNERGGSAGGIPAVRCTGLTQRFGDTVAVDNLDLDVAPGEVFGLLGPNGAGKTTTIRMITTLLKAPKGSISVFGVDVASRRTAVRRLIGYVPQQLSADATLTGRENVALFARLYDVPRRTRTERVAEVLAEVDLADVADRPAKTYSGGMVRRLELAQALVSAPHLLILDEPTVGLDPVARDGVWARIEEIQAATGMTVLVTTHLMQEADQHCDRVALMHRGRIRALGTPAELRGSLGPDATLDDVFRAYTGDHLGEHAGTMRDVRSSRRTAGRVS
jgi:ABC-2 type transport system ATP-binding protein